MMAREAAWLVRQQAHLAELERRAVAEARALTDRQERDRADGEDVITQALQIAARRNGALSG